MSQGPRTIDGYTVIRELGRGGMGVVFEVHDPKLDRRLALKLMLGQEADPEALQRFQREAELLARLNHPGVVTVHGLGTCDSGPYFVAERIEGAPLDSILKRRGALEPRTAAALVRDLASAVGALHAEGIIHRDLKPGNVIRRPDGSPVLIDFGLARDPRAERLTLSGTLLGTPNYMSPEQALGESAQLTTASDVYALGAVLFALLAGVAPYEGLPVLSVLDAITRLEPTWPLDKSGEIPPRLEALCLRAMDKDPGRRPTAIELSEQLEALLESEYAWSETPSRSGRSIGIGALLALGTLAPAIWLATRPVSAPTPPSTPSLSPSPSSTPRPSPTFTPEKSLSARDVIRRLRKKEVPEKVFQRARELLAEPQTRTPALRRRYAKALLRRAPLQRVADVELPSLGQAEWLDDTRLVLSSRDVRSLWRWPDWRQRTYERVDFHGNQGINRGARPVVLGQLAFVGGGPPQARGAQCYDWTSKVPTETFASPTTVTALAVTRFEGRALLALGTMSTLDDDEGRIELFDLETKAHLRTLRGHNQGLRLVGSDTVKAPPQVSSLVFTRDGHLLSGGYAGDLIMWRVSDGSKVLERRGKWGNLENLALHPTRPLLAASDNFGTETLLFGVPSLAVQRVIKHDVGRPWSATFSRDGRFLYAATRQRGTGVRRGELLVYDLEGDEGTVGVRPFPKQGPNSLALSPDGRRLAVYSEAPKRVGIFEVYEVDVPPAK
jgi:serine/threonine protein kinase